MGIPVQETTLGNLGFRGNRLSRTGLHRGHARVDTEILSGRESKSRPDTGVVRFEHRGFNHDGKLVCQVRRSRLMLKKPVEAAVAVS